MPKKAYVEITNCCNLSCSFCHGTARPPRFMTLPEFSSIAEKLSGSYDYLYFHLLGEPLLHPDLPEMIRLASSLGFRPMLTTNGTLLPSRLSELQGTPLYKISISLHAPEANGAFASPAYLAGCLAFSRALSARGVILVFRLWNLGGEEQGNPALLSALHEAFPAPWQENRSGFRLADHVFLEWGRRFTWPDLSLPELGETGFCYGLRDQLGVLADGTVVPCCLDAEGAAALGNLHLSSLSEILSSPRARAIYDGFSRHRAADPLCRRCGYALDTERYREKKQP